MEVVLMADEKRLIDANVLMDTVEGVNWYHIDKMGYLANGANSQMHTPLFKSEDIFKAIENAPAVDAVEVVRCKDCKRWEYDARRMAGLCKRHINYTAEWDFCSYGERKDDGK
jgi:hypothetical protein